MTPKWEDTEEIVSTAPAAATPSWDDTEEVAPTDYSNQEVSQLEALGTGAIQGSTLGTAPIASGIGGGIMDIVEGLGDKLGLTTDSQLEEQGFTFPDKKKGMEGLLSEYYDSRDRMKGLQDASAEQHPLTTLAGNVLGSLPMAGATGVKVASNAGTLAKMAAGAKEGLKLGAATGFGSGDGKLLDGEVYDTFRDTADSAVGGALMGAAIPGAIGLGSKALSGVKSLVPGLKSFEVGQKLGKAGYDVTEESVDKMSRDYSHALLKEVQKVANKAGLDKKQALQAADDIGIRINAGDTIDEAVDDIMMKGAFQGVDKKEKDLLVQTLKDIRNGVEDVSQNKLDLNRAKMQQKMEAKGYELLDDQVQKGNVQDYVSDSTNDKNLLLSKQNYQKIAEESDDLLEEAAEKTVSKPVEKLIQQAGTPEGVPLVRMDAENLKLQEMERLIKEINRFTGFGDANPIKGQENVGRMKQLAGELRRLSDESLQVNTGEADINRKLRTTFGALNKAGIDADEIYTGNRFLKDDLADTLENITTSEGNRKKANQFFDYMKEIDDPTFTNLQNEGKFVRDANKVAKQASGTLQSSGLESVFGSMAGRIAKVGNFVGKSQLDMKDMGQALFAKKPEALQHLANRMAQMSQSKVAQQFARPMQKAAEMTDGSKRTAVLYGLYQQPAFRELYQSLGEDTNDIIMPVGTDREDNN